VDAEALQREALSAIEAASTADELEELRVRYLGRKSDLAQALRGVRDRETGMLLNGVRDALEAAVEERRSAIERAERERTLTEDVVDVTLPGDALRLGHLHPITQTRRQIEDVFIGLGYEVRDDREVETTEYNFDKLAFDPWHPARSPRATFFFDEHRLLRTETSPSQIYALEEREPPIYMVSIGRCYRRDAIDATHYPIFHQFEGLAVDRGLTLADLKGTLLHVMRALYGPDRRHLGLLRRQGQDLGGNRHGSWMGVLVFDPREPNLPPATLLDLSRPEDQLLEPRYETAVQSMMLFDRAGEIRVRKTDRIARRSAVALDETGRVLLLVTEGSYTLWETGSLLQESGWGLVQALALDGGNEATLIVNANRVHYRTFENDAESTYPALVTLPSILAVEPRERRDK
jgi:phenylalanyl-tRNA synthetase alpha subunit